MTIGANRASGAAAIVIFVHDRKARADFRFWPILLQKSTVTDDVVRPFQLGRRGLVPRRRRSLRNSYATQSQSLSGWRSRNQRYEPPQVLSNGGQNKLVLSASWTTQSKPTELQDAQQNRHKTDLPRRPDDVRF
jgi:hypothetical protein